MRPNTSVNINAADASINENGLAVVTKQVAFASAQAVVTGTSSGTLSIQYSDDEDSACTLDSNGKLVPTNWSAIGSSVQVTITGTAGVFSIPVFQCCYNFIRAIYTKNNGSAGTISVNISTQGF